MDSGYETSFSWSALWYALIGWCLAMLASFISSPGHFQYITLNGLTVVLFLCAIWQLVKARRRRIARGG